MTMSLINVYKNKRDHVDAYDMGDEFVKEIGYRPRYIPEFDREAMLIERLFYPEKHIFNRHGLANCEPREGGMGNMVNCGAAMYISPVGTVNACNPKAAYDEAIDFACGHQLSYGLEAAGVLAACIAKAYEPGATIHDVVAAALELAKDGTKNAIRDLYEAAKRLKDRREEKAFIVEEFFKAILPYSPVAEQFARSVERVGIPTHNYTPSRLYSIEELPVAIGYLTLFEDKPVQAVIDGVNSGRDADSVGVMAGCIAGALYGYEIFDPKEIEVIDKKSRLNLDACSDSFIKTAREIIESDLEKSKKMMKTLDHIL
jgi:ADP-ribosylglycohydrolase